MPGEKEMSAQTRALLIGLAGPALQAVGILWEAVHIVLGHLHEPLSVRHIIFEPGFLVIFVGFLVSLVCVPLALEVVRADAEDLEMPDLADAASSSAVDQLEGLRAAK